MEGLSKGYFTDGIWYKNDGKDGQLSSKGNYKDDKMEGLWKWYYKNGQLKSEENYINGEIISKKCWDEDGNEIECEE